LGLEFLVNIEIIGAKNNPTKDKNIIKNIMGILSLDFAGGFPY